MTVSRSLTEAVCRSQIEANITGVARGQRTKEEVLQEAAHAFSGFFQAAAQQAGAPLPWQSNVLRQVL